MTHYVTDLCTSQCLCSWGQESVIGLPGSPLSHSLNPRHPLYTPLLFVEWINKLLKFRLKNMHMAKNLNSTKKCTEKIQFFILLLIPLFHFYPQSHPVTGFLCVLPDVCTWATMYVLRLSLFFFNRNGSRLQMLFSTLHFNLFQKLHIPLFFKECPPEGPKFGLVLPNRNFSHICLYPLGEIKWRMKNKHLFLGGGISFSSLWEQSCQSPWARLRGCLCLLFLWRISCLLLEAQEMLSWEIPLTPSFMWVLMKPTLPSFSGFLTRYRRRQINLKWQPWTPGAEKRCSFKGTARKCGC